MNKLHEIIQAQNKIDIKNFSNSINELENSLANGDRIKKRSIELLFRPIDEVFLEFGNKLDYSKYKDLYNNIFLIVCEFEKIFVERRLNTRNFFIMLKSLGEDFEKKVSKIDDFENNSLKDHLLEFKTKFQLLRNTFGDTLESIRSTVNSDLESIRSTVDSDLKSIRFAVDSDLESSHITANGDLRSSRIAVNNTLESIRSTVNGDLKSIRSAVNHSLALVHSKVNQEFGKKINDVDNSLHLIHSTVSQEFSKKINNTKRELYNNFYKQIVNEKNIFEKNNKINLEPHLNYLELNANIPLGKYDRDFKYKIPAVRNRLIPIIEKNVYLRFSQSDTSFVNDLKKILELVCNLWKDLEKAKKKKTQEILNARRNNWLDYFVWNNDQEYLDYAQYWKNDFIVDEFLGAVGKYINWKYPIAYIEPNIGELTRHMISGDPFYVIDDRKLPYEHLLKELPEASQKKIHRYNKKTAVAELEESSLGVCVSWNNYPFMTQGKISADIAMVSKLLRPGGVFVFNYVNAHSVDGAKFVEKNNIPVIWKERLDRFTCENNLTEISGHEYNEYPFTLAVYQKAGKMPDLPVANKIGLVLPK